MALAPVAPQLGAGLIQFDQKKAPAFFRDVNKDPVNIQEWCTRIEHKRTSLRWTQQQAYQNAKNALFSATTSIVTARCRIS